MIKGMFDFEDVIKNTLEIAKESKDAWQVVLPALLLAWFFPNTQNIVQKKFKTIDVYDDEITGNRLERVLHRHMRFEMNILWLLYLMAIAGLSVWFLLDNSKIQEFIYFQF